MTKVVIVSKYGQVDNKNIKCVNTEELYKKCNFKSCDNFSKRHTWKCKDGFYLHLFSKDVGKSNNINKYELPPPLDKEMYYGSLCILMTKDKVGNDYIDLSSKQWEEYYEELYGGFEDINDNDSEHSEDELEYVSDDYKTSTGYLKDGFIVDEHEESEDSDFHYELEEEQYTDEED